VEAQRAAAERAAAVAVRVEVGCGDAAARTLGRAESVRAQWTEQDAARSPRGGTLARRHIALRRRCRDDFAAADDDADAADADAAPDDAASPVTPAAAKLLEPPEQQEHPESLRRVFSVAAARIPSLQRRDAAAAAAAAAAGGAPPPRPRAGRAAALAAQAVLAARLAALGLQRERVAADGNCQFRALATLLLGSAERHAAVRAAAMAHLRAGSGGGGGGSASAHDFASLFDTPAAFTRYCEDMSRPGTWGDELTLAAVANAYGVEIHVLQSTAENWHVFYAPPPAAPAAARGAAAEAAAKTRRVFVAYIAPVHYDAIVLAEGAAA
jgi:hypothetical protein